MASRGNGIRALSGFHDSVSSDTIRIPSIEAAPPEIVAPGRPLRHSVGTDFGAFSTIGLAE